MAKKTTQNNSNKADKAKKPRQAFVPRALKRLAGITKWLTLLDSKLKGTAAAPIVKEIQTATEDLSNRLTDFEAGWAPPRKSSFAVGDEVIFKADKLKEMQKSPLYKDEHDLDATLEIEAVDGRKIKIKDLGVFPASHFERAPAED